MGLLSREDPAELGLILIESPWKAARRPYHKQKLALVLSNLRHFALEQAERGVAVCHRVVDGSYGDGLKRLARELKLERPVCVMEPAERELRVDLAPLVGDGLLEIIPHEGWLTTQDQFERSQKSTPWRMDAFYRLVRRESDILMSDGKPVGGKFSFDAENRKPWKGDPPAPPLPTFPSDPIKDEVGTLIETQFANHPGKLDLDSLPATVADTNHLWSWAKQSCLPNFGPYEDAMSTRSTNLFHTRVSSVMNLHRILPSEVVDNVAKLEIPLASKEGMIRQVLGWREFMHHTHVATDGFRESVNSAGSAMANPVESTLDEGATPSFLGADHPLPPAFWGEPSGLACLDRVVRDVWEESYSHHITRLMILSNLATLLDISPRELTDWFWVAYSDAYDWVVEPNVLAMGTFALGDLMTTKPYISGAAYIDRMSDYCKECKFNPKKDCPITSLYWAFLDRHQEQLGNNPRMRMPFHSLKKRDPERRRQDLETFETVCEQLGRGERVDRS
jgi:deoxyribodipyrimidine photolyase-related protein